MSDSMRQRGGTTVMQRPRRAADRPAAPPANEGAPGVRREGAGRSRREEERAAPRGRGEVFDLSAWVFGIVANADTPAEPFRQGLLRRDPPAPRSRQAARGPAAASEPPRTSPGPQAPAGPADPARRVPPAGREPTRGALSRPAEAARRAPPSPPAGERSGTFTRPTVHRTSAPEVSAAEGEPARRRERFDLGAWVFGMVQPLERTPDAPTNVAALRRRRPAPPARKALTLPDLFDGAAVPPCLRDD